MLDIRRPEPKAALTWVAVWLIALIGLALVPLAGNQTEFSDLPDQIQYSAGPHSDSPKTVIFARKTNV